MSKVEKRDLENALKTVEERKKLATGSQEKHQSIAVSEMRSAKPVNKTCQAPGHKCTKRLFSAKYCLKHEMMYGGSK